MLKIMIILGILTFYRNRRICVKMVNDSWGFSVLSCNILKRFLLEADLLRTSLLRVPTILDIIVGPISKLS